MRKIKMLRKYSVVAANHRISNAKGVFNTKLADHVLQSDDGCWGLIPQSWAIGGQTSRTGRLQKSQDIAIPENNTTCNPTRVQLQLGRKRKSYEVPLTELGAAGEQAHGQPRIDKKRKSENFMPEDQSAPKLKKPRKYCSKAKAAISIHVNFSDYVQQDLNGCWLTQSQTPLQKMQFNVTKNMERDGTYHVKPGPPNKDSFTTSLKESPARRKISVAKSTYAKYHKSAQDGKPLPVGEPPVWAEKRQALCEALPYYRAYMSGAYVQDGVARSLMVDKEVGPRDKFTEEIIITRV
jgi:hypothetical protein